MSFLFGKPKQQRLPDPVRDPDRVEVAAKTRRSLFSQLNNPSILTSAQGLLSETQVNKKRLLGD